MFVVLNLYDSGQSWSFVLSAEALGDLVIISHPASLYLPCVSTFVTRQSSHVDEWGQQLKRRTVGIENSDKL